MSTLKIFAVRDNKVSCYMRPFVETSEIMACRSLYAATQDPQIQLSMYPDDFDLYLLADMDEVSGQIVPLDHPKFIVSARAVGNLVQRHPKKEGSDDSENSKSV